MADIEGIIKEALDAGFDNVVPLDCSTIRLLPEVRAMCEANKCGIYNKNWSCPPACGTLDECAERVSRFKHGIIVQTIGELEDEFDFEGIQATSKRFSDTFYKFTRILRNEYPNALALGAGGCKLCEKCTYPDAPCRAPERAISSMESYGMVVSDVCTSNNVPYYYGRGKQVFVGCYLID